MHCIRKGFFYLPCRISTCHVVFSTRHVDTSTCQVTGFTCPVVRFTWQVCDIYLPCKYRLGTFTWQAYAYMAGRCIYLTCK